MKRVGLIDNLQDLQSFIAQKYDEATAAECMAATGGNTGNVAFVHAARKIIGNPITRVGWGWTPAVVRERVDHLVICCANQLGKHADLGNWADRLEQFGLPVTLIGIGAQSDSIECFPEIPDGTKRFLKYVAANSHTGAVNIATRGMFTKAFLSSLGIPSESIGCPSLHISSTASLGRAILDAQANRVIQRVAVAAGNPWHVPSAHLEPLLVEIVDAFRGDYVIQHPESMLSFAFGESEKISEQVRGRFISVYKDKFDFEGLMAWYRRNATVYVDAASWIRAMRKYDLVVGPRYHGVALGIQAGTPGCVITIDSRTEELCLGTGIKHIKLADALSFSAQDLVDQSMWNKDEAEMFDDTRRLRSRQYLGFLEQNNLMPSNHLCSLVGG